MNIQTNGGMENQGSSQLLQLKILFSTIVVRKLVQFDIHKVFSKDREEIHEVVFRCGTYKRHIHIDIAFAAGVAITTVHVNQERDSLAAIQLGEVRRCGKTELHSGGIGTEGLTFTGFLVDVLQLANPQALLFLIGRRECGTEKHRNIHRLVFGQGETSLQASLHITQATRCTAIIIDNIAIGGNRRQVKLVVIDRDRYTHIKVVPDAQGKTHIGIQGGKILDFSPTGPACPALSV